MPSTRAHRETEPLLSSLLGRGRDHDLKEDPRVSHGRFHARSSRLVLWVYPRAPHFVHRCEVVHAFHPIKATVSRELWSHGCAKKFARVPKLSRKDARFVRASQLQKIVDLGQSARDLTVAITEVSDDKALIRGHPRQRHAYTSPAL